MPKLNDESTEENSQHGGVLFSRFLGVSYTPCCIFLIRIFDLSSDKYYIIGLKIVTESGTKNYPRVLEPLSSVFLGQMSVALPSVRMKFWRTDLLV